MTIKYIFRDVLTIKAANNANPQKIGESLAKIAAANNGHLTPHAVVEAAKEPRHVLHKHFEWDDVTAATQFRVDQARNLIRCIRVEDANADEGNKPAFLSISDRAGTSYRTVGDVEGSVDLQALVLAQAEKDLIAFENRYKELEDICAHVRQARQALTHRKSKLVKELHARA